MRRRLFTDDDQDRQRVLGELIANQAVTSEFLRPWYDSNYTFRSVCLLGFPACKIPTDLWVLQDLLFQFRFKTVVECGTAGGGTTLWYAFLMDLLGIAGGLVYSVDFVDAEALGYSLPHHPRIIYMRGSSTDPKTVAKIPLVGPVLIDLDTDHHAEHVRQELDLWAPLVPVDSWLIVEDTNGVPLETVTGQPATAGPMEAVKLFLADHPGEWLQDALCERFWLTMNPGGWLQRVEACSHEYRDDRLGEARPRHENELRARPDQAGGNGAGAAQDHPGVRA